MKSMRAPNTFKKTVIAVEGLRFDALAEGPVDGEALGAKAECDSKNSGIP